MREVLRKFGIDALAAQPRPLVAETLIWEAHAPGRALRVVRENLTLIPAPLSLVREVHLQDAEHVSTAVLARLALCWNGSGDALELMAGRAGAFQRAHDEDAVVNTAAAFDLGDIGVAWSWSGEDEPDVLMFVRNNVFAGFEGHDARGALVPMARSLDEALRKLRTVSTYTDAPPSLFADVRRTDGDTPRVLVGGRLELGPLRTPGDETLFFQATGGSVNRVPPPGEGWYFRAGLMRGRHEIAVFSAGKGILPSRERLPVDIV